MTRAIQGKFLDMMIKLLNAHKQISKTPYGIYKNDCEGCNLDHVPADGAAPYPTVTCDFVQVASIVKPWINQLVGPNKIESVEVVYTSQVSSSPIC